MLQIGLIGATNVGKSTLFNRLIGQFRAIVTDIPGTTRDILLHHTKLEDLGDVIFADSPGLLNFNDEFPYIQRIVQDSDVLLLVIDDTVGITAKEQTIIDYVIKSNKKNNTLLVINKLDLKRKEKETNLALADYYDLGFENIVGISAKTSRNVVELQDLLWDISKKISPKDKKEHNELVIKPGTIPLAILGKPNAGKSTLLNGLVGQELSKVENIAGTTRDYIMAPFTQGNVKYTLYDTPGLRKKGSMESIEKIAYQKTIDMLKFIRPVVIFLVDMQEGISHRDMTLLEEVYRLGLSVIMGLNKSDLFSVKEIEAKIKQAQRMIDFAKYIPIIPLSAKMKKGGQDVISFVPKIYKEATKRIDTAELNKVIGSEFIQRPPRFPKNKICKPLYVTQIDINTPTFLVFVNHKIRANFAFKKWIDNVIRNHFGFVGVPLVISFRDRGRDPERDVPRDMKRGIKRKKKK